MRMALALVFAGALSLLTLLAQAKQVFREGCSNGTTSGPGAGRQAETPEN